MSNTPLNHKTLFVFDHSSYFLASCGQTFEFDVPPKSKQSANPQAQASNAHLKLNPLNKSLWSCNVESAIEFARIVYDLFPENKLIRMMTSRLDRTLNTWNDSEQGLEHLMNIMGTVPPSFPEKVTPTEEFIFLCKALDTSVKAIAQASPLQQTIIKNKPKNSQITNSGRIILFTSAQIRNLDPIQEFLVKSIEDCNKTIELTSKNDPNILKINKIELVIIDVVKVDQNPSFEKDIIRQNSEELRSHLLSTKSGSNLPLKLIQLAQQFYELSVTSVTNIPMKEELNANSSANYDVDILHHKSLHDQLKVCGLLKNCIVQKDGVDAVCLKWSNPKTNITEFNLTTSSFRITPIDVNSRPASCLTSFLLSGRCVVLEIPRSNTSARISSHVLCTHGNEIFMHSLNYSAKSYLEDRPSIDNLGDKLKEYRTSEFIDFMKANTLSRFNEKETFNLRKISERFDKTTRNWPITYTDKIITNLVQLKPLLTRCMLEEPITDVHYTECIKSIESIQSAESKNEQITSGHLIVPQSNLANYKRKDIYKLVWTELENFLKLYQDFSDKHKFLYNLVKSLRAGSIKNENLLSRNVDPRRAPKLQEVKNVPDSLANTREMFEFENEKLSKRKKLLKDVNGDDISLFEYWSKNLNEKNKSRMEFYGRATNPPNQIAPLYVNLKLDENPSGKTSGPKMEIS